MAHGRLSASDAKTVHFFYGLAKGDREATQHLMDDFRDEDEGPSEAIAALVEEFFSDIEGYTAMAEEETRRTAEAEGAGKAGGQE